MQNPKLTSVIQGAVAYHKHIFVSSNLPKEFGCVATVMKAFQCHVDGFLTLARHALYALQPRYCRDLDREEYHWIKVYGSYSGKQNAGHIVLLLVVLAVVL